MNERIEKILKIIHARIEEKYRDFRTAFRAIDKDFGGQLEFKEFMLTLEELGIKLKLTDFKLIFDALDFDGRGHIDFTKFCYLNADRYSIYDLQKRVRFNGQNMFYFYRKLIFKLLSRINLEKDHPFHHWQCLEKQHQCKHSTISTQLISH